MAIQTLDLSGGRQSLFLATPLGVVEIKRVKGDNRKIKFDLPPVLKVFLVHQEAIDHQNWMQTQDGRVVPRHDVFQIERNKKGEAIGVTDLKGLTIGDDHDSSTHESGTAMENGKSGVSGGHAPDPLQQHGADSSS